MTNITRLHALAFMLLCLLVAATLRLPDLTHIPPGLHYDEAANGVLASEIGLQGERPIFISSYTGKEVLFFYLAGGLMYLLGPSVFTLRLTAAFVGLLTIAVMYWLGREWRLDRRIIFIATALMAPYAC
jgi:predicted membrane-bound mannosyltransferase